MAVGNHDALNRDASGSKHGGSALFPATVSTEQTRYCLLQSHSMSCLRLLCSRERAGETAWREPGERGSEESVKQQLERFAKQRRQYWRMLLCAAGLGSHLG
jgi:hypothetical protein